MPRPKNPPQCTLDALPQAKRDQLALGTLEAVRRWLEKSKGGVDDGKEHPRTEKSV